MTGEGRDSRSAQLGAELEDAFLEAYPGLPPAKARHMARNLTQVITGVIDIGMKSFNERGISHMDTANALVYWCTTNSSLEEAVSAGLRGEAAEAWMGRITGELAARAADLLICLEVLRRHPALHDAFIRGTIALGTSGWERDRGKLEK